MDPGYSKMPFLTVVFLVLETQLSFVEIQIKSLNALKNADNDFVPLK